MSYIALVTERYDEVSRFYAERLGFSIVKEWDRSNVRGRRYDTGTVKYESDLTALPHRLLHRLRPGCSCEETWAHS